MEISKEKLKSYLRDINLSLVMNEYKIDVDVSKRNDKRQFLRKNYKLIKYITKSGGVLVGSRALRCYSINGKQMLDRRSKDWDFVITRDMAFKICDHFGIRYDLSNFISVQKQRWTVHPSYSDSYRIGAVDVQMIIKSELPEYIERNGIRISNLPYTINQKAKLMDETDKGNEYEKHKEDLLQTIRKFNSL